MKKVLKNNLRERIFHSLTRFIESVPVGFKKFTHHFDSKKIEKLARKRFLLAFRLPSRPVTRVFNKIASSFQNKALLPILRKKIDFILNDDSYVKNYVAKIKKSLKPYMKGAQNSLHLEGLYPWHRWDIIIATTVLNLFSLAVPIAVLQLYDRIIPQHAFSTYTFITIGVLTITVAEALVRVARYQIMSWLGIHYEYLLTNNYFSSLLYATLRGFNSKGAGQHIENIESASTIREFEAGQGFIALLDLPFVILFLMLVGYFAGAVALAPIIALGFFIFSAHKLSKKIRVLLENRLDVDDRRYNFLIEILTNHQTLKGLGMEHLILRRYESIHTHSAVNEYELSLYNSEARNLGSMYSSIIFVGVVFMGAILIVQGEITTGVMTACTFLSNRIMQPVQSLMGMWTRFQHYEIAKHRHTEMSQMEQEKNLHDGVDAENIQGDIELDNVRFYYDPTHPVLANIHLKIPRGSFITIMGPNGCGKTTLTYLMMGLYPPQKGEIRIDRLPLDAYNIRSLRNQMAYVSSHGTLFQGTVMDNLTIFRSDDPVIVKEAMGVAEELDLKQWINRLPDGYDTQLASTLFSNVSAGLQQRICLARALISKPKILILDEANTALDKQGDDAVKKIIEKLHGKATIIFVTHRPSISRMADAAYRIENHSLVLVGKKEELSATPSTEGLFV